MSRQISFFHSEYDAIRFIQKIAISNGLILIGDSAVPPASLETMILSKMCTYSCKLSIIPIKLVDAYKKSISDSMTIEFNTCCKGNSLSRTYEMGRIYVVPGSDGNYVPETAELYESLRKYIKTAYRFEKKAGAYFAPDFWDKFYAHYYHATCAGRPVLI